MELILAGPVDGKIETLYHKTKQSDASWILCTGSWGTWPDPNRLDRGTRKKAGSGDFAKLYVSGWQAPKQTLYIAGAHEDHRWLRDRFRSGNMEVMPNVHFLANGYRTTVGDWDTTVRVTGLGKVYSESTFHGKFNKKSHRHYTRSEFEKACTAPTDILLLHEPPNKIVKNLIFATRPKLIVHSSRTPIDFYHIMNVPTIGLVKGQTQEIVI